MLIFESVLSLRLDFKQHVNLSNSRYLYANSALSLGYLEMQMCIRDRLVHWHIHTAVFNNLFNPLFGNYFGSFMYGVFFLLFNGLLGYVLLKRKIYIKL